MKLFEVIRNWIEAKREARSRQRSRVMSCQMRTLSGLPDAACVCGWHPDRFPVKNNAVLK